MNENNSLSDTLFLGITAAICGAFVMVLEVLGSRVIGPFFGVSLFAWTSLITVTLVALSIGYAAGGVLSDKKSSPDYLYGIILLSGILVMLIPVVRRPVLLAFQSYGLRMGSFLSTSLLFGPSLILLGCVSPYIVRLAAKEVRSFGRVVGIFYAISTIGSFIGTVVTGYVLIAYFDVYKIFMAIGLLLVLTASLYFVFFKKHYAALTLLVVLTGAAWQYSEPLVTKVMQNGTTVSEVFRKETFYGTVKVVDYRYGGMHARELVLDGQVQGGIDYRSNESIYAYAYFLEIMPYLLQPQGKSCLVIGLGAGIIPVWYERQGIRTDVVEINPHVVRTAEEYFAFSVSGDVYVHDARYFLEHTQRSYDYIILDVFSGDTTPAHMLSREALSLLRQRLTQRGILAINLIGSLREQTYMTASVVRTLESVFQKVAVYPAFSPEEGDGIGNLTILAHEFPFGSIPPDGLERFPIHTMAYENVKGYFGKEYAFAPGTPAVLLRDSYNPMDFYDVWLKEKTRKGIFEGTDPEILL